MMDFSAVPLTGVYLLVAGIVISFFFFLGALINMGTGISGHRSFPGLFTRHLGAMAGMSVGSLVGIIGLIVFLVHALQASRAQ